MGAGRKDDASGLGPPSGRESVVLGLAAGFRWVMLPSGAPGARSAEPCDVDEAALVEVGTRGAVVATVRARAIGSTRALSVTFVEGSEACDAGVSDVLGGLVATIAITMKVNDAAMTPKIHFCDAARLRRARRSVGSLRPSLSTRTGWSTGAREEAS